MRIHSLISHLAIGCAGAIAAYVVATGHLAMMHCSGCNISRSIEPFISQRPTDTSQLERRDPPRKICALPELFKNFHKSMACAFPGILGNNSVAG